MTHKNGGTSERVVGSKLIFRMPANDVPEYLGADGETLAELGPLGRVDIFVGANDSGKSRLMRALLRSKEHELTPPQVPFTEVARQVAELRRLHPFPELEHTFRANVAPPPYQKGGRVASSFVSPRATPP